MAQILLAEPDRPIRDFIAGILTDFGHGVTACGDGCEAAALLATGPVDVLVTDLVLRDDEGSMLSRHCAARDTDDHFDRPRISPRSAWARPAAAAHRQALPA